MDSGWKENRASKRALGMPLGHWSGYVRYIGEAILTTRKGLAI